MNATTQRPFSVQCPACDTWFPIDPERVPPEGVRAICSSCMRVFKVDRPAGNGEPMGATPGSAGLIAPDVELETEGAEEGSPAGVTRPGEDVSDDALPPPISESAPDDDIESVTGAVAEAPEDLIEPSEDAVEVAPSEEREVDAKDAPVEDTEDSESEPVEPELGQQDEPEDDIDESSAEEASPVLDQSLSKAASRFGRRDPHDRARRLARVLVSDMLTYHPAQYEEAVAQGRLKEEFEEEIRLSWEEYEEQVGRDLAESTDYFIEALNEILARGETLFRGVGRPE